MSPIMKVTLITSAMLGVSKSCLLALQTDTRAKSGVNPGSTAPSLQEVEVVQVVLLFGGTYIMLRTFWRSGLVMSRWEKNSGMWVRTVKYMSSFFLHNSKEK